MSKGFPKLALIALMTLAIMLLYRILLPNYDNISSEQGVDDTLLVIETISELDSLTKIEEKTENHKQVKSKKKKKYVKKIKPVSFAEIAGGDDFTRLTSFFSKLKELHINPKLKVRIAYFGDSITESDLATNQLRKVLQDSLGGAGIGFIPAVSNLSQYRASIKHTYSQNWNEYSISKKTDRKYPLGLFGNVAVPSQPLTDSLGYVKNSLSWHSYSMMDGNPLAKPVLMILNPYEPLEITYIANRDTLNKKIEVSDKMQFISLSDSLLKYLSISYFPQDTCYVYGVDFSDDTGIYIDNYSLRGNKGNNFVHLDNMITQQSFAYFNYDLTILHYGANVTDPIMKDYSWYRISMKKNIRFLQNFLNNEEMILFSVGDRGALKDSLWFSSPDLPYLIKEQKRIAKDTNISFFNLFTALGGEKANVELEKQALLTPDHTHFTRKGAKHFGDLLFNKLMREYHNYLENN